MEFRNLTPFDVINYKMLDVSDTEHHVIVMKIGYALTPAGETGVYNTTLLNELPLCIQDSFISAPNTSSIRYESDLAPFKPLCDVIVNGTAYAPDNKPAPFFDIAVTLRDKKQNTLLNKSLRCYGPRQFVQNNDNEWQLTTPKPIHQLPLDYRYAFGGECKIYTSEETQSELEAGNCLSDALREQHPEGIDAPIAHATCEYNPLGRGFITSWYAKAKGIKHWPAPQIEFINQPITAQIWAQQLHAEHIPTDLIQSIANLGAIGRAWQPRRQLAGTYDDNWLATRHPNLPQDFHFGYWNCAPQDQQIVFPSADFTLTLENLTPNGWLQTTLPGHRPFVLLRMQDGMFIPIKLNLDTLCIDTDKQQLALTYRLVLKSSLPIRVCEARFEMKPDAPLVRFADAPLEQTYG